MNLAIAVRAQTLPFLSISIGGWGTILARAAAVALGLSVGATVANLGVQVWLKLRKCCGSGYQELCDTERDIKKIQDYLIKAFDKFDFGALTGKYQTHGSCRSTSASTPCKIFFEFETHETLKCLDCLIYMSIPYNAMG